jgi:hypothetical protein
MEEMNKKYDQIYTIFKDFQSQIDEFSGMSWGKLDVPALIKTGEDCEKLCKRLSQKLEGVEAMSPF